MAPQTRLIPVLVDRLPVGSEVTVAYFQGDKLQDVGLALLEEVGYNSSSTAGFTATKVATLAILAASHSWPTHRSGEKVRLYLTWRAHG